MPSVFPHSLLSDFDISLFLSGKHTRLYDKLGAFELERKGEIGTFFAVWAPNAEAVYVIGNFNFWDKYSHPLLKRWDSSGIWEGFIPGIRAGRPTAEYLDFVLSRITLPGAFYLGLIALIPLIALATIGANQNFPFGGTSILIIVGVGLETVKQIDAQLQQRHYEGLLG